MSRDTNIDLTMRRLADHELWLRSRGRQGHPYSDPAVAPSDEAYAGGLDLTGSTVFSQRNLSDQVLANMVLDEADLSGLEMVEGTLAECRLRRATVHEALFKKTDVSELDAAGADFTGTRFIHTYTYDNDFSGTCFDQCLLVGEGWERCRLQGSTWVGARLDNSSWWDIDLTGTRFDGLSGTLMPPDQRADNWWSHHATEVFDHINATGGRVTWDRQSF